MLACQNVVEACGVALAEWMSLPSTLAWSSTNLYGTPLVPLDSPQATIWIFGLSQTAGLYPICFAQFLLAQSTLSNSAFNWGLTSVALPLACCQVDVPLGEVTVGTGDGVAAGVLDVDEAGVADGVGVGLAFACAAATAPSLLALRVSSADRLPPAPPRSPSALAEAL